MTSYEVPIRQHAPRCIICGRDVPSRPGEYWLTSYMEHAQTAEHQTNVLRILDLGDDVGLPLHLVEALRDAESP